MVELGADGTFEVGASCTSGLSATTLASHRTTGIGGIAHAIPESLRSELVSQREVGSVGIIFKILTVYQPGGLGERTTLLKQLVDQKVPSALGEWLTSLRA